jgi:tetratricopeptide (TPR) repeat protein
LDFLPIGTFEGDLGALSTSLAWATVFAPGIAIVHDPFLSAIFDFHRARFLLSAGSLFGKVMLLYISPCIGSDMKRYLSYASIFLSGLLLFSSSPVRAYTSSDYYNAGLQLYNAKNYPQAIQYFSAAINLDPNNVAALQGRANCNYALGQYQQALEDYQKVQALQPNPQLASLIQALQAKVGASTAAPSGAGATAAPLPSGGGGSFNQGVALFQQQQYAQAIPWFQKAVQENPNDSKAYYYLGVAQMQSGDTKDAAVALGLSNKIQPNPSVQNYVNQLKARLTPDDQQWVDSQVAAGNTGGGPSTASKPNHFGIRLEPAIVLINMADFNAEAQAGETFAKNQQGVDPSFSYNASVPSGYANIAIEPVYKVSPQFELGLPIALGLMGNFTESVGSSNSGGTTNVTSAFSAFSVGLNARYLMPLGKDMDLFVAGGPLVVPINMNLSASATTITLNASSLGFGGQVQLGLDYHLTDSFVVGPFAGFQLASASGFTATYQGVTAEAYVYTSPSPGQYPVVTAGPVNSPPAGTRPLTVDLSGPYAGIQIAGFF